MRESDHLAFQAGVAAANLRALKECIVGSDQQCLQIWSGTVVGHNVQGFFGNEIYTIYFFFKQKRLLKM